MKISNALLSAAVLGLVSVAANADHHEAAPAKGKKAGQAKSAEGGNACGGPNGCAGHSDEAAQDAAGKAKAPAKKK